MLFNSVLGKSYSFKEHRILFLSFYDVVEKYPNMRCYSLHRDLSGMEKKKYKIAEHISGGDMSRWYGDWKKDIQQFDTVFIGNGGRGPDIVSYLNKVNPNLRVIVYYYDTVYPKHRTRPSLYKDLRCEMYTFDIEDARRYGMQYKHFFYPYMHLGQEDIPQDETYLKDIFFVGQDKNRLGYLLELKKKFSDMGLSCDFYIKRTPHRIYLPWNKKHTKKGPLQIEEVIRCIKGCRAILEIVREGQHGITYRAMEAMCFGKKLITNLADIVNYPFYRPENIFILGQRDLEEIPSFLAEPLTMVDESLRDEYVFENWLESFFV